MDMKLEVVVIPVSDVDRARDFYKTLGWRLDADVVDDDQVHLGTADPARFAVLGPVRHRMIRIRVNPIARDRQRVPL